MRPALLAVALVAVFPLTVAAQQEQGPTRGTWGVEGSSRLGGSLLRFRSPASAWVMQVGGGYMHVSQDGPTAFLSPPADNQVDATLRFGLRRYRRTQDQARPFTTLSIVGGYEDVFRMRTWTAGVSGDVGAAYFFTPHVSLGGAGELEVDHSWRTTESGSGPVRQRILIASFNGFRLIGSVYF